MDPLLVHVKENDGSDLHLVAGQPPRFRSKGAIRVIEGQGVLSNDRLSAMMQEIASPRGWEEYATTGDLDFAFSLEGVARYRANYFVQQSGVACVFRIIPEEIISLENLNLPQSICDLADLKEGLVLVTGPTGSGKSTTLAAIIDKINKTYSRHVVTIEDPVEFVHQNRNSLFSHREVGLHTQGFGPALRSAIRQDADVILVGEMREQETISLAITAAEMGMLVFGTLHTNNAAKTIDRIIDAFPAEEQNMVRLSLSESLAAIVSQLLLPRADQKGRIAANEILLKTPGLPNLIRDANTPMLASLIQSGKSQGMQAMDDVLFDYVKQGKVSAQDAYMKATDKARFEPLLK
ncbi:MAG: PilT/PilU family type 4a pilus ATPase [Spirochaetaceae bacterium]|nr:PilT/PilU family type 4a pilus ATPase [Myxococcales bacterium]MCB9726421.1 PilT/PilU family type 4a pilus ATPase [Spirochaetaceae bacterium]HPG24208.1 PilT/PilU family type 4a pilus ATPase [Myxococcota bacterium]